MNFTKRLIRPLLALLFWPSTAKALAILILTKLPFFSSSETRLTEVERIKNERRSNKESVGWTIGTRQLVLSLGKHSLLKMELNEGEEATVFHFFLRRKISFLTRNIRLAEQQLRFSWDLSPDSAILEPGCGAGKYLLHLTDKYNCKGIGYDIYPPAINIAKRLKLNRNVQFYCADIVTDGTLSKHRDKEFDLVLSSSHLVHILHLEKDLVDKYITELLRISKKVLAIEKYDTDLLNLLKARNISFVTVDSKKSIVVFHETET